MRKLGGLKEYTMASITALFDHPDASQAWAQTPPREKSRQEQMKDLLHTTFQRLASGRTTALGRRVEKPGNTSAAGPSGQHETAKHGSKHTNK